MTRYVARSFVHHARSLIACGIVTLAGATLLVMLAVLLETGLTAPPDDRSVLILLPVILGGWSVAIVAFGIVSTVSLAVQQREQEIALLRSIGATPRNITSMVVAETAVCAVVGVALAMVPGTLLGTVVLDRLIDVGMVSDGSVIAAGPIAYATGAAITLLAAVLGAVLAGRRAAAVPPTRAMSTASDPDAGTRLMGRRRVVAGTSFVAVGAAMSATTLSMADGPLLSSTAGPAGVAVAVGLAILSPFAARIAGTVGSLLPSATARYGFRRLKVTAVRQTATIGPLVLLIGIAAGTLLMQSTEDAVFAGGERPSGEVDLAPVNYLVVGIIIAFTCIAAGNSLVSSTRHRRREFAVLRLNGATHRQVVGLAVMDAVSTTAVATMLGGVAAAATVVPFSLVRTGSPWPTASTWLIAAVVGTALLIALAAAVPATVNLLRGDGPELALRAR